MKTVNLNVEDYLYAFYEKVAVQAGRTTEQAMADVLFRFAGEASMGPWKRAAGAEGAASQGQRPGISHISNAFLPSGRKAFLERGTGIYPRRAPTTRNATDRTRK